MARGFTVWKPSFFKPSHFHQPIIEDMDSIEIRNRADECLSDFDALVMVQPTVDNQCNGNDLNSEEQRARFLIWSANIGIFADGHASLDYRLRENWEARTHMLDLLESLKNYIRRGSHLSAPLMHVKSH